MKYKMRDVAEAAGVSIATVSNVFNNKTPVAEKTRILVLQTAENMGYKIDNVARTLKTGKSYTVGFIIPDISSIFFAILTKQVEEILEQSGYSLIVSNSLEKLDRQIKHLQSFSSGMVDAVIIASCENDFSKFKQYMPANIPALFVDRPISSSEYSEISVNFRDPLYKATEDLLASGYHNFGVIIGLKNWTGSDYRIHAIRDCLHNYGIPLNEENILYISDINIGAGPCALELYKRNCNVIFCPNSNCTREALDALLECGAVINRDVTLLAINDDPRDRTQYGNMFPTVVQPSYEIGTQIAHCILELIKNPESRPLTMRLAAEYRPVPKQVYYMKKWLVSEDN
jgi:DNA-binding LacI/PurR family transcriptional regulator